MKAGTQVAIIGGGISGLSTAFYLQKAARKQSLELEITLLEQSERLGGVIRTERAGELLLEAGPEGWASYKPAARQLVNDLGLNDELLGSNDQVRRTYIARQDRLECLPDGMTFLAPIQPLAFWRTAQISRLGKIRTFLEPFVSRSRGDLSVRSFFARRLGAEFTDELIEPFIAAVFGAEFDKLSAPSVLPELYRAEQRKGSLWRGLRRFARMSLTTPVLFTMRAGMSCLTDRLEKELAEVRIVRGLSGLRLVNSSGPYRIQAPGYETEFDHVVLSTPAHAASRILAETDPELSCLMREIPYASSRIVYLAYKEAEFSHPLDGFGFIVPSEEAEILDACTWVNRKFDGRCPPDTILLRCAIHDGRRERQAGSDDETVERTHGEIKRYLGIRCTPYFQRVFRLSQGMPQLLVGHLRRLQRIESNLKGHPGMFIASSFYGGVGLPDCIRTGRETAEKIVSVSTR